MSTAATPAPIATVAASRRSPIPAGVMGVTRSVEGAVTIHPLSFIGICISVWLNVKLTLARRTGLPPLVIRSENESGAAASFPRRRPAARSRAEH